MVTAAYHPEITGGATQCRALAQALRGAARISVLSVTSTLGLPREDVVDGVRVVRVLVEPKRLSSKMAGAVRLLRTFVSMCRDADIVHLHGYTQKSVLLIAAAKLLRKPVLLKLGGVGQDAPAALRARGAGFRLGFAAVDRFIASSSAVGESLLSAGIPAGRLEPIPNGVDVTRFRPATIDERARLRRDLGLPATGAIVLFVGMMAPVKRPELLFDAWTTLGCLTSVSVLVFCTTRSAYGEIDSGIPDRIRARAARLHHADRVVVVEPTFDIEKFYRAADVYVLPSASEGLPNALLEAMASGLPCIASRLPGITDTVIDDGRNGVLVESGDLASLANALRAVLDDPARARELGRLARETIVAAYGIDRTAAAHVALYRELLRQ